MLYLLIQDVLTGLIAVQGKLMDHMYVIPIWSANLDLGVHF